MMSLFGGLAVGCGCSEFLHCLARAQRREEQENEVRHRLLAEMKLLPQEPPQRSGSSDSGLMPRTRARGWKSIIVAEAIRPFRSHLEGGGPEETPNVEDFTFCNKHADPQAVARENVVVLMVGLPARGKSYISGAIVRHLHLLGVRARSFNAGELRRQEGMASIGASFFSADNKEGKEMREKLAMECCNSMLKWLDSARPEDGSSVAILDATNSTPERRYTVLKKCAAWMQAKGASGTDPFVVPLRVLFLESICDDPIILQQNYEMKKLNDDYKDTADASASLDDFKQRVSAYEQQYTPVRDSEIQELANSQTEAGSVYVPVGSIRVINGGLKLECHRTGHSLVTAPVVQLLHAMHLTRRRLVLVPEEQATPALVAACLLKVEKEEDGRPMDVICSASAEALEVAEHLEQVDKRCHNHVAGKNGAELCTLHHQPRAVLTLAELGGLNRGEPESASPRPSPRRRGERFPDLVRRMREVILLIERLPRSVMIVCERGEPWKVLLAHFQGCPNLAPPCDLPLPVGPIVELRRDHKGFAMVESHWPLEIDR